MADVYVCLPAEDRRYPGRLGPTACARLLARPVGAVVFASLTTRDILRWARCSRATRDMVTPWRLLLQRHFVCEPGPLLTQLLGAPGRPRPTVTRAAWTRLPYVYQRGQWAEGVLLDALVQIDTGDPAATSPSQADWQAHGWRALFYAALVQAVCANRGGAITTTRLASPVPLVFRPGPWYASMSALALGVLLLWAKVASPFWFTGCPWALALSLVAAPLGPALLGVVGNCCVALAYVMALAPWPLLGLALDGVGGLPLWVTLVPCFAVLAGLGLALFAVLCFSRCPLCCFWPLLGVLAFLGWSVYALGRTTLDLPALGSMAAPSRPSLGLLPLEIVVGALCLGQVCWGMCMACSVRPALLWAASVGALLVSLMLFGFWLDELRAQSISPGTLSPFPWLLAAALGGTLSGQPILALLTASYPLLRLAAIEPHPSARPLMDAFAASLR